MKFSKEKDLRNLQMLQLLFRNFNECTELKRLLSGYKKLKSKIFLTTLRKCDSIN